MPEDAEIDVNAYKEKRVIGKERSGTPKKGRN